MRALAKYLGQLESWEEENNYIQQRNKIAQQDYLYFPGSLKRLLLDLTLKHSLLCKCFNESILFFKKCLESDLIIQLLLSISQFQSTLQQIKQFNLVISLGFLLSSFCHHYCTKMLTCCPNEHLWNTQYMLWEAFLPRTEAQFSFPPEPCGIVWGIDTST